MLYTIVAVVVSIAVGIFSFSFVSSQLQLRNRLKEVAKYVPKESIFKGKKILVLLNPIGGDGKGLPAWNQFVEPMLKKAQIQYELIITKHHSHACEVCAKLQPGDYAAILLLSGDGMTHQVVNGIAANIKDMEEIKRRFASFPMGIIPTGTQNGFAASFVATDIFEGGKSIFLVNFSATKRFIEGSVHPIDISEVRVPEEPNVLLWDMHAVYHGIAADHDELLESKAFRFLGIARKTIIPIYVVPRAKEYKGKLRFLPIEVSDEARKKYHYWDYKEVPVDPKDPNWRILEGSLSFVTAMNVPYAANKMNFAPGVNTAGGEMDLYVIRKIKSIEITKIFLNLENGSSHIYHPDMRSYKVRAMELYIERDEGPLLKGHILASGEVIPYNHVIVTSQKGLGRLVY